MCTTKIAIVSFLGNRNHIIFLSWHLFAFISLVMQKYSKWLLTDPINIWFKFFVPVVYTFRFWKEISEIIHTSLATIPIWHCSSLTWWDSKSLRQKSRSTRSLEYQFVYTSLKFYGIFIRSWTVTCMLFMKKYSLWSNCIEYKRNVVWRTTKWKDKPIWIFCLK